MNIYQKGKATLKFDAMEFDFADQVLAAISDYSLSLDGEAINSLEVTHKVPNIKNNLENCRQVLFSLFRTSGFQEKFKHLGAQLIDEHFNGVGLLQKTPTVRIQIPGAESTSYHSDGWYGHGASVKSFWMPLTKVTAGNTLYMAKDAKESEDCLHNIISAKANLRDINSIAKQVCEPFEGGLGDILTFTSAMIHGANKNTLDYTRVSFDFRIAPDPDDIGSKPRSNFFSRQDLDN